MAVAGKLIGRLQGSYFTDLFDDRQPQTVMAGMLFTFIEPAEHSSRIERDGQAGVGDR